MRLAPIVLFVFNRPEHTRKTVEALSKNVLAKESELYVYSDSYRNSEEKDLVSKVRNYIKTIKGFKKVHIIEREKNYGLAKSVIWGVSDVLKKSSRVIVLEDDLITSSFFLQYMNELLEKYENEKKVYSITGFGYNTDIMQIPPDYPYDIYFSPRAASWSWATWSDRWKSVDWEVSDYENFKKDRKKNEEFKKSGEDVTIMLEKQMQGLIDSWAIRWAYHHYKMGAYCIYPVKSYINNIGFDGSGVHCGTSERFNNHILNISLNISIPEVVELDPVIMKNFQKIFKRNLFKKLYFDFLLKHVKKFF